MTYKERTFCHAPSCKKKNCAKICVTQTLTLDVVGLRFEFVAETFPVNLVSADKHCFD